MTEPGYQGNSLQNTVDDVALVSEGATATASTYGSFSGNVARPQKAIDGDHGTFWGGTRGEGDWIQIDLGQEYTLDQIHVDNGYHTLTYDLKVSTDQSTWTTIADNHRSLGDHYIDGHLDNNDVFQLDSERVRYIQIAVRDTNAPFGHIWQAIIDEVTVFPSEDSQTPTTSTVRTTTSSTPETTTTTQRETSTTPQPAEKYNLREATNEQIVVPGTQRYKILWDIPGIAANRRAVVTPEYELVEFPHAFDALVAETWANKPQQVDWDAEVLEAKANKLDWTILKSLSRGADLSIGIAAAIGLGTLSPLASLPVVIETLQDFTQYAEAEANNAYKKRVAGLRDATATLTWIQQGTEGATSVVDLPDEHLEVVEGLAGAADDFGYIKDVAQANAVVGIAARNTDSIRAGLIAGGTYAKSIAFQVLLTKAVSLSVSGITGPLEANAISAAFGVAHNAVRIPILRDLARMQEQVQRGTLSPPEIIQYKIYQMVNYQLAAVGTDGIAEFQRAIAEGNVTDASDRLLGVDLDLDEFADMVADGFDVLFNSSEMARIARQQSNRYSNLANYSAVEIGVGFDESRRKARRSINREVFGRENNAT